MLISKVVLSLSVTSFLSTALAYVMTMVSSLTIYFYHRQPIWPVQRNQCPYTIWPSIKNEVYATKYAGINISTTPLATGQFISFHVGTFLSVCSRTL